MTLATRLAALRQQQAIAQIQRDAAARITALERSVDQRVADALARLTDLPPPAPAVVARPEPGPQGPPGPPGPPGPRGPAPAHQWKGANLRFQNPNGTWGKYVNLRGPGGAIEGEYGADFDPAAFPQIVDLYPDTDTLILERNGEAYRISISALQDLVADWRAPDTLDGGPANALQTRSVDSGTLADTPERTISGGSA